MRPIRFASTGHIIQGSGLFDGSSGFLTKTLGTATNRKKWTAHFVLKIGEKGDAAILVADTGNVGGIDFSAGQLRYWEYSGSFLIRLETTALFRDYSGYLVIDIAFDSTQSVAADRVTVYANGTELTSFTVTTYPSLNFESRMNGAVQHRIGATQTPSNYYNGYGARVVFIDGQALAPTDFGEVTDDGFWQINDVSELDFTGTNSFLIEGGVDMAAGLDTSNGDYASTDTEVSLLMHMEGSDTSTTFLDSSRKGHILTANANAQIDTAVSKFGTSAALFDGNTDNISIPKNSALSFGTGDFIVEAWMNFDSVNTSSVWKTMCNVGTYFSLGNNSGNVVLYMASVFSDPLSLSTDTWYHICFSRVSGTVYFFVNGVAKGSASYSGSLGSTETHFIGAQNGANANPMDGHIDELRIIKGRGISSAFTPETSAYSNPLAANDFGITGTITATNDSPTNDADNGYGSYWTWDALFATYGTHRASAPTLSNGNLTATGNGAATTEANARPIPTSGKWYFEITITKSVSDAYVGLIENGHSWYGSAADYSAHYRIAGGKHIDGSNSAYGTAYTTNDILGFAIDMDNGAIYASKNGTYQNSGDPTSGASKTGAMSTTLLSNAPPTGWAINAYFGNASGEFVLNTGQSAFNTAAPTGYLTLNTANLSTPVIINPDDHFFSTIIDHDGSDTDGTCTFNLDTYEWLAIIKNTTGAAEKWYWINTLHGITEYLSSDSTADYTTDSNVLTVSGTTFTLGSTLGAKDYLVEFHKAGLTADKASNTAGTINTTATSYNATSGFAMHVIPSNSGSAGTVGNPLTSAPEFVIQKAHRVDQFACYHTGLTDATKGMQLNSTTAEQTNTGFWDSTAPTASVISLGTWDASYIKTIFAWHGVEGYSAFGSYEGNGNSDGPFLNMSMDTGMFLMKSIDAARAWMYQHKEFQVNGESNYLLIYATNSLLSTSTREIDIVSTGVKLRGADGNLNHAETNIYCAWGGRALTDGAINQGRAK